MLGMIVDDFHNKDMVLHRIAQWKKIVEDAGGVWIGLQESFSSGFDTYSEPLAIFRRTDSSHPLALSISQMTEENIQEKLNYKKPKTDASLAAGLDATIVKLQTAKVDLLNAINDAIRILENSIK